MDYDPLRRGFAEFVGTFALIFVGAGSVCALTTALEPAIANTQAQGVYNGLTLVAVAFANGLVIGVMASAVGHISGGHFNPAVTFGLLVTRRIAPSLALVYWSVQLLGATAAAALLKWFFSDHIEQLTNLGSPAIGGGITTGQAVVIEAVLTFFLVWVLVASAVDPGGTFKSVAGLAIGFTITLDVLMGGPLTGGAMNPARAFGPELLSRDWTNWWVWYVGPLAGGGLAALAYEWLYLRPTRPLPVGPAETGVEEPRPGDAAVS
jgi:aquaporin TIP